MPARRKSRQHALQILYLWDLTKAPIEQALRDYKDCLYHAELEEAAGGEQGMAAGEDPFMEELARGTAQQFETLDAQITRRAEHWRLERMPVVDRNILRMAIYEMKEIGTPAPVVIDEALELARRYTSEDAIPFLNGVLDAVRKALAGEEAQGTAP